MRIREARMRDAAMITDLIPESEGISEGDVMGMIQKMDPKVYVAADFSANILGFSLSADKVFLSPNCLELGVADELKSKY